MRGAEDDAEMEGRKFKKKTDRGQEKEKRTRAGEEEVMKENDSRRRKREEKKIYDISSAYGERIRSQSKDWTFGVRDRQMKRWKERERETDMYFYIKCPDVTSSEGVQPRGSTLINKVTQR